jgi:hypothetical protein
MTTLIIWLLVTGSNKTQPTYFMSEVECIQYKTANKVAGICIDVEVKSKRLM